MKVTDKNPPRYMIVLKDFKTDVQIQVGAVRMSDFIKPLKGADKKKDERFELERVIRFFESKVKETEKEWLKPRESTLEKQFNNDVK